MELSREDVLRLNKIEHRYTAKQIEEFIDEQMADGVLETDRMDISDDESFEKLILAYDISMRKTADTGCRWRRNRFRMETIVIRR